MTGRILRRMGPEVVAVETASCALDLLEQQGTGHHDIGFQQVKTKALFVHMPIILMTGHCPNQIVDEGKARTLGLLLNKPLDSASL